MLGLSRKLRLLLRRSRYLLLGLLAVVLSGVVLAYITDSTAGTPLESTPPLRRLGNSEFRLTWKGGDGHQFCFSPDGKRIAGANWDEVRIWSFPDGKLIHDFSDRIDSRCIAFSVDGETFLALQQNEMMIYHFEANTGKLLRKVKLADVVKERHVPIYALSADGRWLLSKGGAFTVWNTTTGKQQFRKQFERMSFSHGMLVSRKGVLTAWDSLFHGRYSVEKGEQLVHRSIHRRLLEPISNPEGTLMAAYSRKDQAIVFWDSATEERVGGKIPAKEREWRSNEAAISADGKRFVYWVENGKWVFDRKIAVYDVATGKTISEFKPPDVYFTLTPVISPDGKYVFPAGYRSVFTPIDTETGRAFKGTIDHVLAVSTLSFTPDGSTLLVCSGDKRQAWDVETGKPGPVFEHWRCNPSHVEAVDNNRALVTGLRHGGLRLHDISTGEVEQHYLKDTDKHLPAFQLSLDRKSFSGIIHERSGRFVRRWDIASGNTIAEWSMPGNTDRMGTYGPYAYCGLALGGSRLYWFDQVQPPKKLPDGTLDWGRTDLLLEDWTTQEVTNRLAIPAHNHFAIANSADCSKLAAVVADDWHPKNQRGYGPGSTYLLIWDVETGKEQLRVERQREGYFSSFSGVAVSSGGRLAATASHHSRIEIWDGFTGQLLQILEAKTSVTALVFSDDGGKLASGHQDGSVYLWDTRPAWKLSIP